MSVYVVSIDGIIMSAVKGVFEELPEAESVASALAQCDDAYHAVRVRKYELNAPDSGKLLVTFRQDVTGNVALKIKD